MRQGPSWKMARQLGGYYCPLGYCLGTRWYSKSSPWNSIEDRAPVDEIYTPDLQMSYRVLTSWQVTRILSSAVATGRHGPFSHQPMWLSLPTPKNGLREPSDPTRRAICSLSCHSVSTNDQFAALNATSLVTGSVGTSHSHCLWQEVRENSHVPREPWLGLNTRILTGSLSWQT